MEGSASPKKGKMTEQTRPSLAERLAQALEEGLAVQQGQVILRTRTIVILDPSPEFDRGRILR